MQPCCHVIAISILAVLKTSVMDVINDAYDAGMTIPAKVKQLWKVGQGLPWMRQEELAIEFVPYELMRRTWSLHRRAASEQQPGEPRHDGKRRRVGIAGSGGSVLIDAVVSRAPVLMQDAHRVVQERYAIPGARRGGEQAKTALKKCHSLKPGGPWWTTRS